MPSLYERSRNNIRAGIFVTVTLVLAFSVVIVLSDAWQTFLQRTNQYMVTFDVASGVKNLKAGAKVRVGGVEMGEVTDVRQQIEDEVFQEVIEIDFTLDQTVELYSNATVLIASPLIGADAWIDIISLGGPVDVHVVEPEAVMPTPAPRLLADGGDLEGTPTVGMLTALLGPDNQTKTNQILDDVMATSAAVRAITARVNEQTIDKVEELLGTGQAALDAARVVMEDVGREFDHWTPDIRAALGDIRLAAQSLKFAGIELRRSPWKILYKPSKSELEHELLYEAARSFAMAASDLKAASESVQRVMDRHADRLNDDPQIVERLNAYLLDSLDGYEKAQQRLIDVLLTDEQ
ncbi:MAG: MlaD family protein [Planctomycetota bacterium]|nr:MlaD family protein [Planctomycetota bacterium]